MGKEIVECSMGERDFWHGIQDVMSCIRGSSPAPVPKDFAALSSVSTKLIST